MDLMSIRRGLLAQMMGSGFIKVDGGYLTIGSDTDVITVSHNLGVMPNFAAIWVDTDDYDNQIDGCVNNVQLLTGSVVATEAAQVKSLGDIFRNQSMLKSFEELRYFTSFTEIPVFAPYTEEEKEENAEQPKDYSRLWRNLFWIVLGLGCLIYGSNLFIDAATYVAHRFGVRQSVIGLTIVAGGTSLPELATSVVAAYKGRSAIAIGNVIGSNVFNILLILGITSFVHPLRIMGITIVDLMMLLVSIGFLWLFAYTKFYVSRREGGVLVGSFIVYMSWLFYIL